MAGRAKRLMNVRCAPILCCIWLCENSFLSVVAVGLLLALAALACPTAAPARVKDAQKVLGKRPADTASRAGTLRVSEPEGAVVRVGDKIVFQLKPSGVFPNWHWSDFGPGSGIRMRGPCKDEFTTKAETCAAKAVAATPRWTQMAVQGTGGDGGGDKVSTAHYAVVSDLVISGTVVRRSGDAAPQPVGGASVVVDKAGRERAVTVKTAASGEYSALVDAGTYVVSVAGAKGERVRASGCSGRTVKGQKCGVTVSSKRPSASADFRLGTPPPSLFFGVDRNGLRAGDEGLTGVRAGEQIAYTGEQWDADGGPIEIFWGNGRRERVASLPAAADFTKRFTVPHFPGRRCDGELTASQDGTKRRIPVSGLPLMSVAVIDGKVKVGRGVTARRLKRGSFICEGEDALPKKAPVPNFPADAMLVPQLVGGGLLVFNPPKRIRIVGSVFTPDLRVAVAGERAAVVRFQAIDVRAADPGQDPGVQTLPEAMTSPTLEGSNRRQGDLEITGGLKLEGATLWVDGDLTISGGATGRGAIFATGRVEIRGRVDLQPQESVSIAAEQRVVLFGR